MSNRAHTSAPLASAEQSVLGAIIIRNETLTELDTLETADFSENPHRVVFEAMRNLEAAGKPIDVVTLDVEIEKAGKLDAIGGIGFLGQLCLSVPTMQNVREYARLMQERSTVRRIALVANDLLDRAQRWEDDPNELLGGAMAELSKLDRSKPDSTVPAGELVKRRVKEFEAQWAAQNRGEKIWSGAPTGIASLDKRIGGYPFGDVSLLAARPGMGKTAMAMAATAATTAVGFGAHVFSQEGGWRMYADRLISQASGVSVERLRSGDLRLGEPQAVSSSLMKYGLRKNWLIDDRAGLSASEIIRSVRRWQRENKTRLVVVDYLNILRRNPRLDENAALEAIINEFAQAAPADDIAWLILCQLNREVEKRPDKRPQKSDLRGSGSLEQVGRIIVSPYRGSYYYNEPKKDIDYDCDCPQGFFACPHVPTAEQFQQLAQVVLLKNSNGQEGRVFATWRGETTEIS